MAKRRDEEICRECFDALSRVSLQCSVVEWHEVPQSEEPPDWFLTLDGKRFAVEASTITDVFEWNDSVLGVSARFRTLCKSVEKQAQAERVLQGVYVVSFSPMAEYSAIRTKLRNRLLEYIRDTVDQPSAREEVLFEEGPHRVGVQKLHDKGTLVGWVILLKARWEGEAIQQLSTLLQSTLRRKSEKLRARVGLICALSQHYLQRRDAALLPPLLNRLLAPRRHLGQKTGQLSIKTLADTT